MKSRSPLAAGLLLVVLTLASLACTGVARPSGWASAQFDDGVVYLFRDNDELSALHMGEGAAQTLWTFPDTGLPAEEDVDLEAVYGTPLRDADTLYLAGFTGEVVAIDAETGRLTWRQDSFDGEIVADLALANDKLFVSTLTGRLYALDTTDGSFHADWPDGGVSVADEIWAPPVVIDDRVFAVSMDGDLHAYSIADGSELWAEPFSKPGAVPDMAAINGELLFVPGFNSHVDIVDPDTGEALTRFEASDWVWTRPFVDGNIAYFGDFSGSVYALDITTGIAQWTYDAEGKVKGAPVLIDGVLIVATEGGSVHFVDATSGTRQNVVPLSNAGSLRANITAHEGMAYVVGTNGNLFRADPSTLTVVPVPVAEQGS